MKACENCKFFIYDSIRDQYHPNFCNNSESLHFDCNVTPHEDTCDCWEVDNEDQT